MHAHASEYLLTYLQPGSKVLDVGSGSGYLTAIFHHLVSPGDGQPTGKVVGIDHIAELVDWSVGNLKKDGLGPALESGQIEMITGDGRKGRLTNPSHSP
jgi:protein-L-isoaspartate(D-aspartate) O-methyltransferase